MYRGENTHKLHLYIYYQTKPLFVKINPAKFYIFAEKATSISPVNALCLKNPPLACMF